MSFNQSVGIFDGNFRKNVEQTHSVQPNSQEYMFYKKYVSIHSEDRNIEKYPDSCEFEIELPEDMLNVSALRLVQWTLPANYNTFSVDNENLSLSFQINNPCNPGELNISDEYNQRIFEALWYNREKPIQFFIEEGFYTPPQMMIELTNKFNASTSAVIRQYFVEQNTLHPTDGWDATITQFDQYGYNRFIVVYNNVSLKLWFGNNADGFTINSRLSALSNETYNITANCITGKGKVPDSSNWGLPGNLGLPRCDISSRNEFNIADLPSMGMINGIPVPRFYYGDVTPGDNGFWLLPNTDLPGCKVNWIEAFFKINLMGEAYIYMEIAQQNCIDETQPYNVSQFTLQTNQTNSIVNSSFAKMALASTPLSQLFDRESAPYKFYYPPAERIRKLRIKLRYHNGRPVQFGIFNYSFMLEFTLMSPQILRNSDAIVYPPPIGR